MINVRGMHLTGVLRDMITVWIAITVFSSSALTVRSVGTVMFPKDVIGCLANIKKSVHILRGETSDHIFSPIIEPHSMGFVKRKDGEMERSNLPGTDKMRLMWYDVFES
jgi:hypothetical protein